jgi:unsaturated rhamnogalacturonyl hydrolase
VANAEDPRVASLARATMRRRPAERLSWSWGEGLLVYALVRSAAHDATRLAYAEAYFAAHARRGMPVVDWSDLCAPGLAAAELFALTASTEARQAAERVAAYVCSAVPLDCGVLNHFGRSALARVYPRSAWVDSMMMYVVFAARWGSLADDARLVTLAAEHARAFGRVLQDDDTGLWRHAFYPRFGGALPGRGAAWLRGNGWALASLSELARALPAGHAAQAELAVRFARTANALVARQHATGLWPTILGRESYLETSGSALVAHGLFASGSPLAAAAERARDAVLSRIEERPDGASLTGISAETMPYPASVYPRIPVVRDRPYGVAAVLLAENARSSAAAAG